MNREEFYLNKLKNHSCTKLPSKDANYLKIDNYLSEFIMEDEKAEARSNLGITPLLEELKALIDAKVIEIGAVPFDLYPIKGNVNHVVSSDVIASQFYNKEAIDEKILQLYQRFIEEAKFEIDEELSGNSINAVQNKVIYKAINDLYVTLNNKDNSLENSLNSNVDSLLQELQEDKESINEINSKIDQLREDIPGMIGNVVYEPIDNEYIENLIRNAYAE